MIDPPCRLRRAMEHTAACIISSVSSFDSICFELNSVHRGVFRTLHSCTFTATCVPNGFVNTTTSPTSAPLLLTYSPSLQIL
eukprot:CAMPEP_0196248796 /NCGR_PEP_ID=MMETSP0913-20130531/41344_1 /TAXON_ID=49265 /ORGANISM="Thalassiosira rotula, Strain GSO102" /LENGTH=81 /DNA_ID=CAMNT_0041534193 /DNA_START=86 /DNA_END=327 /DNA_ORIENTATION=+